MPLTLLLPANADLSAKQDLVRSAIVPSAVPQRVDLTGAELPPPAETKLDRLLKMIPTEVIAAYPAVLALAAMIAWPYYESMIAILGIVAVVAVLHRDGVVNRLRPTWRQYLVRSLAFAAWTLVIGNPLAPLSVSSEHAHVFGAAGAVFVPLLGYLTLPAAAG